MKVYIAAPWIERAWVREFARAFDERAIEITHRWWDHDGEYSDHELMREHAARDVQGVRDADAVVLYDSAKSEGKAVEQGIAIALDKPIIAIGERGKNSLNVFHHLDRYVWVARPDDVFQALSICETT